MDDRNHLYIRAAAVWGGAYVLYEPDTVHGMQPQSPYDIPCSACRWMLPGTETWQTGPYKTSFN
jgi:hypothetical protein